LTCACGKVSKLKVLFRDFSLDIPSEGQPSLQNLLEEFFLNQNVEKSCENCNNNICVMENKIQMLPRILILQLKRFQIKIVGGQKYLEKLRTKIDVPKTLNLGFCCTKSTNTPVPFQFVRPTTSSSSVTTKVENNSNTKSQDPFTFTENEDDEEVLLKRTLELSKTDTRMIIDSQDADYQLAIKLSKIDEEERQKESEKSQFDPNIPESIDSSLDKSNTSETSQDKELNQAIAESLREQVQNSINYTYHLQCIISHQGINVNTGHYVTDALDLLDNKWKRYNDQEVEEKNLTQLESSPYVCFYVHNNCWSQ